MSKTSSPERAVRGNYSTRALHSVHITPEMARDILATSQYDRQRVLRESRVEGYAAAMRRGEFHPAVIERIRVGDQWHLVNGQHRLHAIIQAGIPVEQFLFEYEAPNMETVHQAYQRIDIGAGRTMRDIIRTVEDLSELNLTAGQIALVGTASLHILASFRGSSIGSPLSPYERSEAMRLKGIAHWSEEAVAFYEAVKPSASLFRNAAVIAVALVTFRYQEERASKFWRQVAENDRLTPRSGAWHLYNHLQRKQKSLYPSVYSRHVAGCWNAYFSGLEIRSTLVKNPDHPIEIRGTPYKGNAHIQMSYE